MAELAVESPNKSKKGLSLLEVLVAVTLLGISMFFILGAFPISLRGISDAQNIYLATQVARAQLDYAREKGYDWIVGPHTPPELGGNITVNQTRNGVSTSMAFQWQMTTSVVPPPDGPPGGGMAQIDVSVSWQQPGASGTHGSSLRETTWVEK